MNSLLENWRNFLKEVEDESVESKIVRLLVIPDGAFHLQAKEFLDLGVANKEEVLALLAENLKDETDKLPQLAAAVGKVDFDNDVYLTILNQIMKNTSSESLFLGNSGIEALPDGLIVPGLLDIQRNEIEKLPAGLKVGSLNAAGNPLKELPDDLEVKRSLDLGFTQLTSWPENLKTVNGNLRLFYSTLKNLPDDMHIKGNALLSFSNLREIPRNFRVDGNLTVTDSVYIDSIPPDLEVGGYLNVSGTKVKSVPEETKVAKKWKTNPGTRVGGRWARYIIGVDPEKYYDVGL